MTKFLCPVCGQMLIGEKNLKCNNNHSFDRAKSGYLNLLPGKGGNHGDPKEMVLARKNFLDGGYYQPLASVLAVATAEYTPTKGKILDCGCGECYYTSVISENLPKAYIMGIDVSKDAVNYGAKRLPKSDLAVASVYAMPVADDSIDTVISVFAPEATSEFIRVLKKGGHLIMAVGGKEHLWSLKKAIYDTPYKNSIIDPTIEGLELVSEKCLSYKIDLCDNQMIKNLFTMTPYYHKTSPKDIAKLDNIYKLTTEVEFKLLVYSVLK